MLAKLKVADAGASTLDRSRMTLQPLKSDDVSSCYDLDFYACAWIDEIWIRSTLIACSEAGLACRLIYSTDAKARPRQLDEFYAALNVPIIHCGNSNELRQLTTRIIVTATSQVPREYFCDQLHHLIYMPHSLASLMAYSSGSFDGYDILFAAGPHHETEFRNLCEARGLRNRKVFRVGYGKFDMMKGRSLDEPGHILIAPSCGKANILSTIGRDLIRGLLAAGFRVTVRPHPSLFVYNEPLVRELLPEFSSYSQFAIEKSTGSSQALWSAQLMISDYSGVALEYSALRRRPVIFVDPPKQGLNSDDWQAFDLSPIEVAIREKIGPLVPPDISVIINTIHAQLQNYKPTTDELIGQFVYLTGHVGSVARDCLLNIVGRHYD